MISKSLIVGFLVGLMAGAGWGLWYGSDRFHGWEKRGGREARMLKEFTRELDLSDDQRKAVAEILRAQREKLQSIRAELKPRFDEIRETAGGEIRALLKPDQVARFDALEKRMKEEHPKNRDEKR